LQWFGGLGLQGAVHPEPQFAQYNLGGAFDRKRPPALVKMKNVVDVLPRISLLVHTCHHLSQSRGWNDIRVSILTAAHYLAGGRPANGSVLPVSSVC
jgi:hypothetical protein